jgi:hypothetical protein
MLFHPWGLPHEKLLLQKALANPKRVYRKGLEYHDIDPLLSARDQSLGIGVNNIKGAASLEIKKLEDYFYPFGPLPVQPPPFNLLLILRCPCANIHKIHNTNTLLVLNGALYRPYYKYSRGKAFVKG